MRDEIGTDSPRCIRVLMAPNDGSVAFWEKHKQGWRLHVDSYRCQVARDLGRGDGVNGKGSRWFIWTVESIDGQGHVFELARGRCKQAFKAKALAQKVLILINNEGLR